MDVCHECGGEYERIGTHWSHHRSSCEHPPFTDQQREIITGFLMSDASISTVNKNPYIASSMITKEFLEWVDNKMGVFGKGVRLKMSSEEKAEEDRKSKFNLNAKSENYHDVYQWWSVSHPQLQEFADWYDTGKKVWPESIEFTPLSLKVFFCGDGCFHNTNGDRNISFALSNERNNKEKVEKLFKRVGLSGTWSECGYRCSYCLNVDQSEKCFDIMGGPLPGFKYKWPDNGNL